MRLFRVLRGYKIPNNKSRAMQDPNKVPLRAVIVPLALKNRGLLIFYSAISENMKTF